MNPRALATAVPTIARVTALAVLDRRPPSDDPAVVPATVTAGWLSAALGTRVTAVRAGEGSSGTTRRQRLHVEYAEPGHPPTLFTKSTPSVLQRITQAITGAVEARFYIHLRPLLDVEAPRCFHGAVDDRRMTSITVLEDLVDAEFLSPATRVTRAEAEQVVTTLATVHRTLAGTPAPYLKTYAQTWEQAFALVNVERYFLRCFEEADGLIAGPVRADPERAWRAVRASIAMHDALPATVIHNDVHLGNWYRRAGRMGLCDWQAVVRGHWSRDLAYALSTTLTIEDRRAWERDLVALYLEHHPAAALGATWDLYRAQLWGALAFWAPTYSPPRLMPADMQPRAVSGELLQRISTAIVDHDAFAAVNA